MHCDNTHLCTLPITCPRPNPEMLKFLPQAQIPPMLAASLGRVPKLTRSKKILGQIINAVSTARTSVS